MKDARAAGQGLVAIAGAKVYFILTSYAVQLLLPRIFGAPEEFGLYSTAMAGLAMLNNVLIVATIQSVSKFTSEDDERAPAVLRQALGLQLGIGGLIALALFASAPLLAGFLLDEQLTALFRIMAVVVLSYALYAALVGSLNGRRLFVRQAKLDALFSTLRTAGILTGAIVGASALAAIAGFSGAAIAIVAVAAMVVGLGQKGRSIRVRQWFSFLAPIWLYQGFLNGMLQIDVQVLKRTVAELALRSSDLASTAADIANQHVGYYRAAQTFAFVPYQLIISMTFVVFPLISRATSAGDTETTRTTIRNAFRFSLLILLAVAAPIAGAADGVMLIAYPQDYLAGAPALQILVLGMAAFALFVVAGTVISSAGAPSLAALIGAVGLAVVIAANRVLIVQAGIGEDTLRSAALGTSLGMLVALAIATVVVYRRFHAFIAPKTALRGLAAGAVSYAVAAFFPHETRLLAAAALILGGLSFIGTLFVLRELDRSDIESAREILKR